MFELDLIHTLAFAGVALLGGHWLRRFIPILERYNLLAPVLGGPPCCQGPMRLIAFLTEPRSIRTILAHLGEPTIPPPLIPRARDSPAFDQSPPWDPTTPTPDPGYPFDQTRA